MVFGVATASLILWLGGWGIAAYFARGGRRMSAPLTALVIAGGLGILATLGLEEQLSGKRVAVVRESIQLLDEPVLGSDRGANALVGEVVRVKGVRGAWTIVSLDDGREGWMASSNLIPLDPNAVIAE